MTSDVVLCDKGYNRVSQVYEAMKIKLRPISFERIDEKFQAYSKNNQDLKDAVKNNNVSSIDNKSVIDSISFLDVRGLIKTEDARLIKINPIGFTNIKNNYSSNYNEEMDKAESKKENEEELLTSDINQKVDESIALKEQEDNFVTTEKNVEDNLSNDTIVKAPASDSNLANLRRYNIDGISTKEANVEANEKVEVEEVTPLTIDLEHARTISKFKPLIDPVENNELVQESVNKNDDTVLKVQDNNVASQLEMKEVSITNLEQLKDILKETERLQIEARQAEKEALDAKSELAQEEQAAQEKKKIFVETAKNVLRHQQELIQKTKARKEEESNYQQRKEQMTKQQQEYDKAIADMLDVMGEKEENPISKTR